MGTTTHYAFRYPAFSDSADGPTQIQNLATDVDTQRYADRLTAAFLRATGGQTLTSATTNYMAQFDAESLDNLGGHDNSTNNTRWTVPAGRGGTYFAQGGWSANTTGIITARLYKNGAVLSGTSNRVSSPSGGGTTSISCRPWVGALADGDYLELGMENSVGGATTSTGAEFQPSLTIIRLVA